MTGVQTCALPISEQLMLANTAANSRERTFLTDLLKRGLEVALRHQSDEALNINVKGTGLNANRVLALQATQRLDLDLLERETQRNLFAALDAVFGRPHRQRLARGLGIRARLGLGCCRVSIRLLRNL